MSSKKTLQSSIFPELSSFIEKLRDKHHYNIGIEEFIVLEKLLILLVDKGELPKKTADLAHYISPLLCKSPEEQLHFKQEFEKFCDQHPQLIETQLLETQLDRVQPDLKSFVQKKKIYNWHFTFLVICTFVLLFISVFSLFFSPATLKGKIVSQVVDAQNPISEGTITFLGKKYEEAIENEGFFSIEYTTKEKEGFLVVEHPRYEKWERRYDSPFPIEEIPIELEPKKIPIELKSLLYMRYIAWALFTIFICCWLYKYLTPISITKNSSSLFRGIKVKFCSRNLEQQLFRDNSFSNTLEQIHQWKYEEILDIDIHSTVQATAKKGGIFTPVFTSGKSLPKYLPKYLVLIEINNFLDYRNKWAEMLTRYLLQNGTNADIYYFQGDPQWCYSKNSGLQRLQQLYQVYPNHCVLVFSDSNVFTDFLTGQPEKWVKIFTSWQHRVILTSKPEELWSYPEKLLNESYFKILPATEDGLNNLVKTLKDNSSYTKSKNFSSAGFPRLLQKSSLQWLQNYSPGSAIEKELCEQLLDFLDPQGYFWFSACVLCPILRWDTTIFLGRNLTDTQDKPIINEKRLLSLLQLPWFQQGRMPDWLRLRVVTQLTQQQEEKIKTVFVRLLLPRIQEPQEQPNLINTKNYTPSEKYELNKYLQKKPEDYLFLQFILGNKPSKIDLVLPGKLRKFFIKRLPMTLFVRTGVLFSLISCILIEFFPSSYIESFISRFISIWFLFIVIHYLFAKNKAFELLRKNINETSKLMFFYILYVIFRSFF